MFQRPRLSEVQSQEIIATATDTLGWQAQLRAAVANSISEEDVKAIVAKQIELAKKGSDSAAKFILNQVLGSTPVTIKQTTIITDPETAARLARNANANHH